MQISINELKDRIFSLSKYGIKMGLENMLSALKALDLDLTRIRFVHIAGTNGKGSTAATLDSLIRHHSPGLTTGLYTSPHLIKFNERIVVNGKQISDDEILNIAEMLFRKCEKIDLTFFEFTTLMALCHFINNDVKIAVMETGLGGRLDATNIINPEVAVITSIGYDHMEYLGENLKDIAMEKAGIFKKGSTVVMAKTPSNDVLKEQTHKVGVKETYEFGKDFNYSVNSDNSFAFSIKDKIIYKNINKSLLGEHQYLNSALALTAFSLLGLKGTDLTITQALKDVVWPGRLEPLTIKGRKAYLDVSHNVEGMEKTIQFLKVEHKDEPIYTACGFMKDKDYKKMIVLLSDISQKVFLIPTTVPGRELGENEYKNLFLDRQMKNILICNDFDDAISKITKENGVLLLTGSIYNYEHIRNAIQEVG
jgi:dihydrofolate synthase/folylpolyglutamate synthase